MISMCFHPTSFFCTVHILFVFIIQQNQFQWIIIHSIPCLNFFIIIMQFLLLHVCSEFARIWVLFMLSGTIIYGSVCFLMASLLLLLQVCFMAVTFWCTRNCSRNLMEFDEVWVWMLCSHSFENVANPFFFFLYFQYRMKITMFQREYKKSILWYTFKLFEESAMKHFLKVPPL